MSNHQPTAGSFFNQQQSTPAQTPWTSPPIAGVSHKRKWPSDTVGPDGAAGSVRAKKRLIETFEHLSIQHPAPPTPAPSFSAPADTAPLHPTTPAPSTDGGEPAWMDVDDSPTTIFISSLSDTDDPDSDSESEQQHRVSAAALRRFIPRELVYGRLPRYHFFERPSTALIRYGEHGGRPAVIAWRRFLAAYYQHLQHPAAADARAISGTGRIEEAGQEMECEVEIDERRYANNDDDDDAMDLDE